MRMGSPSPHLPNKRLAKRGKERGADGCHIEKERADLRQMTQSFSEKPSFDRRPVSTDQLLSAFHQHWRNTHHQNTIADQSSGYPAHYSLVLQGLLVKWLKQVKKNFHE